MPRAARRAGDVDRVLPLGEIAAELETSSAAESRHDQAHAQRQREQTPPEDAEPAAEFEALLAYLKQSRGFDFTAYKRASLMRRVWCGCRRWA